MPRQGRFVRHDGAMLQLRTITPADQTEQIADALTGHRGVTNVVVLSGVARQPVGDLIMCDVARESVDEVIDDLKDRGIRRDGSISISPIDLSVSDAADEAERLA